MNTKNYYFSLLFILSALTGFSQQSGTIVSAPSGDEYVKIDPKGKTVIPNGRYLTPAGKSYIVAPHPYGLVLSNDGNIAVTANSGTSPLSISILKNIQSPIP